MNTSNNLIAVSACLIGLACRYDARHSLCPKLFDLYRQSKILALCPEVLGGLKIPRPPCELKAGLAMDIAGNNHTAAFIKGSQKALELIIKNNCKIIILKEFSPSCGFGNIYDGTFTKKVISGNGIFTTLLLKENLTIYTEKTFEAFIYPQY